MAYVQARWFAEGLCRPLSSPCNGGLGGVWGVQKAAVTGAGWTGYLLVLVFAIGAVQYLILGASVLVFGGQRENFNPNPLDVLDDKYMVFVYFSPQQWGKNTKHQPVIATKRFFSAFQLQRRPLKFGRRVSW